MKNFIVIVLIAFSCSCNTARKTSSAKTLPAATNPGVCNIKAEILSILPPAESDTSNICSKYPCMAKVKILDIYGCGSAVALPLNQGSIVEMKFAYTLHSTDIIPNMKAHFPGLKEGDIFWAGVQQRLAMGKAGGFVVYDYDLQK
jgi:hypothetical protein